MQKISLKYLWLLKKHKVLLKNRRKIKGGITIELLILQLLVALSYQTWFWTDAYIPLVQRESNLNLIFMIIKENIRNHRKLTEKLRGYTYKITNISAANRHWTANMVLTYCRDIDP